MMLTEESTPAPASAPASSAPGSGSALRTSLKRRNKSLRRRTLYAHHLVASYSHDDLVAVSEAAEAQAKNAESTCSRFRGGSNDSYVAEARSNSAETYSTHNPMDDGTTEPSDNRTIYPPMKRRVSPSQIVVTTTTTASSVRKQRLLPYYYSMPRSSKRRSLRVNTSVDDSASVLTASSTGSASGKLRRRGHHTLANEEEDSTNGVDQEDLPPHEFHLSDFLYKEIFGVYDIKQTDDLHQERVQNFLLVPYRLEKLLFFGIFLTLDSFLYVFTYLPLRLLYALGSLWLGVLGVFSWVLWPKPSSGVGNGSGNGGANNRYAGGSGSATPGSPRSSSSATTCGGTSSMASTMSGGPSTSSSTSPIPSSPRSAKASSTNSSSSSLASSTKTFVTAFQSSSALVFRRTQVYDLLVAILMAFGTFVLSRVDMSRLYHAIRGQAMIKLYVLFTMIEIFDRLFCSLGQDILNALYYTVKYQPRHFRRVWIDLTVAITYVVLHALLLFAQVVTINVAINSSNASLLTLLLSNNFAELKTSVFKRFEEWNLFQITCSDVVERFKLLLFLGLIALQSETKDVVFGMVMVMLAEMLIDWIKHAFITKFNSIPPSIYSKFLTILCRDLTGWQNENTILDHTHHVSRRLGLVSFPLACVVLRMVLKTIATSAVIQGMSSVGFALIVLASFLCLVALKMLLSLVLMIYAIHSKRL